MDIIEYKGGEIVTLKGDKRQATVLKLSAAKMRKISDFIDDPLYQLNYAAHKKADSEGREWCYPAIIGQQVWTAQELAEIIEEEVPVELVEALS